MKLPGLRLHRAPERQKARLARWLAEWEVAEDLAAIDPGPEPADEGGAVAMPVSPVCDEVLPVAGQVRLFLPAVGPAQDRLLYVALLKAAPGEFLVAPYGRFSEPCLPGELLTGRAALSLRVLCLWNARVLPGELLRRSWVVDELSGEEHRGAMAVLRHVGHGVRLPAELADRVGPPQWHPADPRLRYISQEARLMEELAGDSGSAAGPLPYPKINPAWPRAAEPHDSYGADADGDPGQDPQPPAGGSPSDSGPR